jgi:HD superfamily phosphodiesterase
MSKRRSDFNILLFEVERKWKKQLFLYNKYLFRESFIPSHNEWHHLRVWKYASEILVLLQAQGIKISKSEILELMISVFFHDTGLTISMESDHGKYSRKICEEFLKRKEILIPINTQKILKAVENHDNKTYTKSNPLVKEKKLNIAGILNIADDIDAFGIIGVYRYTEIYFLRGIEPKNLAKNVIPNLNTRFNHFKMQCADFKDIIKIHEERYKQTLEFFLKLDTEFQNLAETSGDKIKIKMILLMQELTKAGICGVNEICDIAIKKVESEEEKLFFEELSAQNNFQKINHFT